MSNVVDSFDKLNSLLLYSISTGNFSLNNNPFAVLANFVISSSVPIVEKALLHEYANASINSSL